MRKQTDYIRIGPWTLKKLICLRKYLYAYTKIIPRYFRRYCYIDTNAGPGVNKVTIKGVEREVNGSPLIALKTQPRFTEYVFIEKKREYADSLRKRVEELTGVKAQEIIEHVWEIKDKATRIRIVHGDCNSYAQQVISWIPPRAHCFVFIDPSGLEIDWETVKSFAEIKRVELLLNFQISGIWRCVWQEKSTERVNRCLGTPIWADIKLMNEQGIISSREAQERIVELRLEQLKTYRFIHMPTMPVDNLRGRLLYVLIFSTRNDTAGKIMRGIMDSLKRWRGRVSEDMAAIALGVQTTLEEYSEPRQLTLERYFGRVK